jgi:hypothetical protein
VFTAQILRNVSDLVPPAEISVEKTHHERRLPADPSKHKHRDVRPYGFHLTPYRDTTRSGQVVFQEDAIDWLLGEQIKGLPRARCERNFTSDSFEHAQQRCHMFRVILYAKNSYAVHLNPPRWIEMLM